MTLSKAHFKDNKEHSLETVRVIIAGIMKDVIGILD